MNDMFEEHVPELDTFGIEQVFGCEGPTDPNGNPFTVVTHAGLKEEGMRAPGMPVATARQAALMLEQELRLLIFSEKRGLDRRVYWRVKPEVEEDRGGFSGYARLSIS